MYDVINATSDVYNQHKKHLSVLSERTGRIDRVMKRNPNQDFINNFDIRLRISLLPE